MPFDPCINAEEWNEWLRSETEDNTFSSGKISLEDYVVRVIHSEQHAKKVQVQCSLVFTRFWVFLSQKNVLSLV